MAAFHRGRVKRRSPTIIEQFTVAAWAKAWRIFRIIYPKSNRIACFRKGGEFSHGLHPIEPIQAGIANGRCGGHQGPFRPSRLSVRCGLGERTLAGTLGNDEDAPKAAIYTRGIDPAGPTRSCRSPPVRHG